LERTEHQVFVFFVFQRLETSAIPIMTKAAAIPIMTSGFKPTAIAGIV
jgi:hypothetical protein